jgi:hypothetical protein
MAEWYYKLHWKMEGWLASKTLKALNSNRSIFYKMHSLDSDKRMREALKPALAETNQTFHLKHKPLHDRIY